MATTQRHHLRIGEGPRTTASMDSTLSDLLSLHLCQRIEHATVQQWCQGEVDKDPSAFAGAASQRLAQLAVLEIAPTELVRAYWDAKLGKDT